MGRRPEMAQAMLSGKHRSVVVDLAMAAYNYNDGWALSLPKGAVDHAADAAAMRIVDLRDVYTELRTAVGGVWMSEDTEPVLTDQKCEWWKIAETARWPFVAQPMVGVTGWYQLDEITALAVVPAGEWGSDVYQSITVVWMPEERIMFQIGQRSYIYSRTDDWAVQMRTWPWSTTEADKAIEEMGPDRWEQLLGREMVNGGIPGDTLARNMRDTMVVLVANTIMAADRSVVMRERVPARLAKAREKRGRGRGRTTAEFMWIDLPELVYHQRTSSFTANRGAGVSWHLVRGHWRTLKSEKFVHKGGQRVWVRPHSRGDGERRGPDSGFRLR